MRVSQREAEAWNNAVLPEPGHEWFARVLALWLIELIEDTVIGEVLGLNFLPWPCHVGDGKKLNVGKLALVFGEEGGVPRAVEVLRGDLLTRVGVQILEIRFRYGAGAVLIDILVDHGHRRLGQNAGRRVDDFELVGAKFLQSQIGFVLPREQDVAQAAKGQPRNQ